MEIIKRAQTWIEQNVSSSQHDESSLKQSTLWARSITWALVATTGFTISFIYLFTSEIFINLMTDIEIIRSLSLDYIIWLIKNVSLYHSTCYMISQKIL